MEKKKRLYLTLFVLFLIILVLIGITYSYFLTRIYGNTNNESVTISTVKLSLIYEDGNGVLVPAEKLKPGSLVKLKKTDGTVVQSKTFSVYNDGSGKVEGYLVVFENVINELEKQEDLVYTLTCTATKGNCSGVSNVQFPSGTSSNKGQALIVQNDIDVGVTQSYELTLYYKETGIDQSNDMKKNIEAKINIVDHSFISEY